MQKNTHLYFDAMFNEIDPHDDHIIKNKKKYENCKK